MKIFKPANRKQLLIIVGSVLVLLALIAGGIYWLMQSTEAGATKSIDKSHTDVGNAIKTLDTKLAQKEITSKERLGAFSQLNQTLEKLSSQLCKDQKSNIVYDLTKAKDRCGTSLQKLRAVKMVTITIEGSVRDDQALAAIMNPAKATDPTDAAKQLEIWTTIVSKLQTVKVSGSSTELKKSLVDASTQYKTAWQELITADKEHNKANYEGTIKRLQAVQGTVVKVSEQQTAQLQGLLAKLKTAMVASQKS
jgi:hypothetical protein